MGKIIENYSLQEILGEGVYGKVYKGIHIRTKQEVAVKVIKADKFRQIPKLEECTVTEINTLSSMEQNPHIVRYLDMLKTVNNFYFVYEYCNGGTLEKLMQQYRNSPEKVMPLKTSMLYFRDIIDAFKTLTKNNIMHRDLKPDNILLHNGVIKIADFGFCKTLKSPTDLAQTMLGSPIYMAPEVITGEVYTMKADIWSLGVVLFEMVYGKCPFNESSIAKLIQILQTQQLEVPFQVPEVVETLIRRMLVKDPARRIDWADLFEYRILETGEVVEPKHLSINQQARSIRTIGSPAQQQLFNPSLSMGSNMAPSLMRPQQAPITSIKQDTSFNNNEPSYKMGTFGRNDSKLGQQQQQPQQQLPMRRRSPMHNQPDRRYVPAYNNSNVQTSSNKLSCSSVSPHRDRKTMYSELIKKHKKLTYVAKLSMDVMRQNMRDGVILSFIIGQTIERELAGILDNVRKEQPTSPEDEGLKMEFGVQLEVEIRDARQLLRCFRDEIERYEGDINTVLSRRNRYLKRYIEIFRPAIDQDIDKAILASQLLDYFEDSILLKKEAYRTLTKEHLVRQINLKVAKLN